jgi:NADP-dependent 3-hydroxy acid dehydrogenase YdfG
VKPEYGAVVLTGATSGSGEATARILASIADALIVLGPELLTSLYGERLQPYTAVKEHS